MARVTHTAQAGTGKYPTTLTALTFTAADAVNFEQTLHTGRELIVVRNSHGSTAYDFTLTSVASNATGRTGTEVVELAAGAIHVVGPLGIDGWRQSDGMLYFAGENAAILFAVVRI